MPSLQRARDGAVMRWGGADTPLPPAVMSPGPPASATVAVSPVRPGRAVTVDYRLNGGPVRQTIGLAQPRIRDVNTRLFRAPLPGPPDGTVEYLPVLRFASQRISLRLAESAERLRYQVACDAPVETAALAAMPRAKLGIPLWDWHSSYLWRGTITIRKEVVGILPDGLWINWHFTEGTSPDRTARGEYSKSSLGSTTSSASGWAGWT